MRLTTGLIFLFFLSCGCAYGSGVSTTIWQVKKSTHFIIYYQEASSDYINEVIDRSENYYNTITEKLGFNRYEEFWTWYKRAKIYLFKNREEYQRVTSQPGWSGSHSRVFSHEVYTYVGMENFFSIVLPHELGHIIFREFIGYGRRLPLWVDEGVATFCEKGDARDGIIMTRAIAKTCFFMDLNEIGEINRANLLMPDIFYAEATSVTGFLLTFGNDKFADFCRRLRDLPEEQSWEAALFAAYKFTSFEDLNDKWIRFLFTYK